MTLNAKTTSTSTKPNSKVLWKNGYQLAVDENRNIAGPPPLPIGEWHVDHFETGILTPWTITTVEVAGAASEVTSGPAGILTLTNGTAVNDSDQIQRDLMIHNLTAAKDFYFECRVAITLAASTAIAVGMIVVDTSLIASAPTDGFYFSTSTTDADLLATTRASSTGAGVSTGVDAVNATYNILGILFRGTTLYYYIDGVEVDTQTANIPAVGAALVPSFAVRNNATVAAAKALAIDYYKIFQEV